MADDYKGRGGRRSRPRRARRLDDENETPSQLRTRRGRLTDLERARLATAQRDSEDELALPEGADRWSTWGQGEVGPQPHPSWLITAQAAVDTQLGVVKTGKEAEVHLIERWLPEGATATAYPSEVGGADEQRPTPQPQPQPQPQPRRLLLAEKRYRSAEHRLFHRDAGYLEGRRTRESRIDRAMANRTTFGRKLIAEQWAAAEFTALCELWQAGAPVPYPVSRLGTDLVLEFIGDTDGGAAPRLAQVRPDIEQLVDLWEQLIDALTCVAHAGFTHGDLSAYNLLVHEGCLVLIDLPQVVDLVKNPRGGELLARDVHNIADWFMARGLPDAAYRTDQLLLLLRDEAGISSPGGAG
ncbi:serine protein kinase RIO [Actinocrinis puniceicyclus]|uniref:serine protein kinase RIO n=1 Tax=Actinocrinis puniceicyclus TaxID=977794 RepID=UPI003F68A207